MTYFLLFDIALSLSRYPDNLSVRRMLIGKLSIAIAITVSGNAMPDEKKIEGKSLTAKIRKHLSAGKTLSRLASRKTTESGPTCNPLIS